MPTQIERPQTGRTTWHLVSLETLPEGHMAPLVMAARQEEYNFVDRLVTDYHTGRNRFDQPGEVLFAVYNTTRMIAVGGLNRDPYAADKATGRVRHLYVKPDYRRQGVGRLITFAIIDAARPNFERLTLRTLNPDAAAFYQTLGFIATNDIDQATHWLQLR